MAEQADALVSKTSAPRGVPVRVRSPAPNFSIQKGNELKLFYKKITILLILTFIIIQILGCGNSSSDITNLKIEKAGGRTTYGQASLEQRNGLLILHLEGTPYEMGYEHGILLKDKLPIIQKLAIEQLNDFLVQNYQVSPQLIKTINNQKLLFNIISYLGRVSVYYTIVRKMEKKMPQEYIDELHGIADGSGIDYVDLFGGNAGLDLLDNFQCSTFVASGKATKDGKLIHARNVDWGDPRVINVYPTLIFYHPKNGIPFASLGAPGAVSALTAMNEQRITINADYACSIKRTLEATPAGIILRKAIQYAKNLNEAEKIIREMPKTIGLNVFITDGKTKEVREIECSPTKCVTRYPENGVIFDSNVYVSEEMKEIGKEYWYEGQYGRYDRLTELMQNNMGRIDLVKAIDILRDRYNWETGKIDAHCPHSICCPVNGQSMIMMPEDGNFWVGTGKETSATDGEYVGFILAQELHPEWIIAWEPIRNYEKNPFTSTENYQSLKYYLKGAEFAKKNQFEKAKTEFEKAKKLDPDCASLLAQIGIQYCYNLSQYTLAIQELEKSISLGKKSPTKYYFFSDYYFYLGKSYFGAGNYKKAIQALKQSCQYKYNDYLKGWAYIVLGQCYDTMGKREEAIQSYRQALKFCGDRNTVVTAKKYLEKPFDLKTDKIFMQP